MFLLAIIFFTLILEIYNYIQSSCDLFQLYICRFAGVVGQEPVLFRGTIYENIAIGIPEATREEVQRVAEMAYAHDFITHLPNVSNEYLCENFLSVQRFLACYIFDDDDVYGQ